MSRPNRSRAVVVAACLLLSAIAITSSAHAEQGVPLVISKVSDNPKKHYKRLKPIVDYVAAQMADVGISKGEVLLAKDNEQMVRYLRQGRVDWVTETPFSSVMYEERAGAKVILRKWKKGVPEYHSILFARRDSGVDSIDDLLGKVVAFEDPGSTSAYFVPSTELIRRGHPLYQLDTPHDSPPKDAIGYVFSGEEINTTVWVHKGLVAAGAMSNTDWAKSDEMPEKIRDDFHIIHETEPLPRALELVRGDLDPAIVERLKSILLGLGEDPNAQAVLKAYERTTRFDFPGDSLQESLDEVRSLLSAVEDASY